jgi:hypothetical protein
MTKLIVYPNTEFEIEEPATKSNCVDFLLSKGFQDIENFHFGVSSIKCTAKFYGKRPKDFKMCLQDLSLYGDWIAQRGLDNKNLTAYNATQLNLLCARDGRER